jgi:TatD DNase family protein
MRMKARYVDIHSHLHFNHYDADRDDVIRRMEENAVATISIGVTESTSVEEVAIAEAHDGVFACIGLHPDDSDEVFDAALPTFTKLVKSNKVVAIGECGLDYSRTGDSQEKKDAQKRNFEAHLAFAVEHGLPVMIHSRDSLEDTISVLESKKREYGDKLRGNAHFFTGPIDAARRYLTIGFTVSFTGVITFSDSYNDIVRFVPLEHMHAETDAPFVAPAPFRGKRNEPTYVKHVYERIADIRGEDREVVRAQLLQNARRVFGLDV